MDFKTTVGRRGVLLGAAALAACQTPEKQAAPTAPRLGPGGVGYIALSGPIVNAMRDLFEAQVRRLLDLNAREIYVLLNSPGGVVSTVQDMIAFIDRTRKERGARFTMHNANTVASGACYLFLAGQPRFAVPRAAFLFHEAALVTRGGALTSQVLQEESAKVQQFERQFLAMLTSKTRLTEAEASSFIRRTVILNADEARRDGIIDAIADFTLPPGATISGVRVVPRPTTRPAEPSNPR